MTYELGAIVGAVTALAAGLGWVFRLHGKVELHEKRLDDNEAAHDEFMKRNDADHGEIKGHVEYIRARIDTALNGRNTHP